MTQPIYLDNHATTQVDPRVCEAMFPFFTHEFGNAGSNTHAFGWRARAAVEKARASIAALIGARGDEIIFTSGATESNNWALMGAVQAGDHVVSTAIEHRSVLCALEYLSKLGVTFTLIQPNSEGQISVEQIERAITPKTKLISVMMANNEIGSLLPVGQIGRLAKGSGILFHCDAVQGVGKVNVNVTDLGIDLLSLSGHKMYGPKGVGALYMRREVKQHLSPLIFGGGQEQGLRAGTLNVPGIVGLGVACDIAAVEGEAENQRIKRLRDRLWKTLRDALPNVQLNGAMDNRLSNNLNIAFDGVDGGMLLLAIQNELAVSVGSACMSSGAKSSHVLSAIGLPPQRIQASIRIGLGRFNTEAEIDRAAEVLILAQEKARC